MPAPSLKKAFVENDDSIDYFAKRFSYLLSSNGVSFEKSIETRPVPSEKEAIFSITNSERKTVHFIATQNLEGRIRSPGLVTTTVNKDRPEEGYVFAGDDGEPPGGLLSDPDTCLKSIAKYLTGFLGRNISEEHGYTLPPDKNGSRPGELLQKIDYF